MVGKSLALKRVIGADGLWRGKRGKGEFFLVRLERSKRRNKKTTYYYKESPRTGKKKKGVGLQEEKNGGSSQEKGNAQG